MDSYIRRITRSAHSILEGMAVTLSWLFRRPCTIQWPDKIEKPVEEMLPERFRGILEMEAKLCVVCHACERACPIDCILIRTERHEESRERFLTGFDIDAGKCMYCGLCVEVCPTGAIRHTTQFAGTAADPEHLVLRYVPEGSRLVPYKPSTKPQDLAPRGSLAAALLRECSLNATGGRR